MAGGDGFWHPVLSGGGGSAGGSSSVVIDADRVTRTTGDLILNSAATVELAAATGGPGTGGFDLTLTATAGDILEVGISALLAAGGAGTVTSFNAATVVSGSVVNNVATPYIPSLRIETSILPVSGGWRYVLQAGDISAGTVKVRPRYIQTTAGNRTLFASSASAPFQFAATIYRP